MAARRGDTERASTVSAQLRRTGRHTLDRAEIAALLGDLEQATILLGQAIELTPQWGLHMRVHQDTDFDPLRDHPPFRELMRPKG